MSDSFRKWLLRLAVLGMLAAGISAAGAASFPGRAYAGNGSSNSAPKVLAWVNYTDAESLARLANSLDIWEVDHANRRVLAYLTLDQIQILRRSGDRVQVDAARTLAVSQPVLPPVSQLSGIPNYPCYRTVEETYQSLQTMTTSYPNLAQEVIIGQSWDKLHQADSGGYDLKALKLTNRLKPGPKPVFLVMAAIHSREYTTAELATRFAEYLLQNYGTDPDVTWLLDDTEIDVIPQANPDGRKIAETGVLWRKNRDSANTCLDGYWFGVDLNRNSSFKWGGSSYQTCDETYQGPSSASEPETQAIQAYIAGLFPARRGPGDTDPAPLDYSGLFISLHSFGQKVLYPWGWTSQPAPNQAQLDTLGQKFGYLNHYYVCQGNLCEYPTTGSTDEWAYGTLGVPGYTFELGTSFFEPCANFTGTILLDNLQALIYAAKASTRPYLLPAGPDSLNVSVSSADGTSLTASADGTRYDSHGGLVWIPEPIQAARYSIDTPSWSGAPTLPMAAQDGRFDQTIEPVAASVDITQLAAGRHLVFVESQDSAGHWGVPGATFLDASYALQPATHTLQLCQAGDAKMVVKIAGAKGFTSPVNLTLTGLPGGTTSAFSANPVSPGGNSQLDLNSQGLTLPGSYLLTLQAAANAIQRTALINFRFDNVLPASPAAQTPPNKSAVLLRRPRFQWTAASRAASYALQIGLDANFNNLLADIKGIMGTSYTPGFDLPVGKNLYWRVQGVNACGASPLVEPSFFFIDYSAWFPLVGR